MTQHDKGMGFRPGPIDPRDHTLMTAVRQITTPKISGSKFWANPLAGKLDQGSVGACVGFSRIISVNSAPKSQHYSNDHAFALYHLAQELDEWPGTNYEGTSVRAGAKAAQQKGLIQAYAFSSSPKEMAIWILNKSPLVIGIDWYESMMEARKENKYFIEPKGRIVGGHAICVDGVRFNGDDKDYFRFLNSWNGWGYGGRCKIKFADMARLFESDNAVACTATKG